jgi:hypothetical protein
MKTKKFQPTMNSVLAKGGPKFTARDHELFTKFMTPGKGDMITPAEFGRLLARALQRAGERRNEIVGALAMQDVYEHWKLTPEESAPLREVPLAMVWRYLAAYFTYLDNAPDQDLESAEDLKRAVEAARPRVEAMFNAVTLFEIEENPGAEYLIDTRDDEATGQVDIAHIARHTREDLAELRGESVPTLDDFYHGKILEGGRACANAAITAARAAGGLERLRATPYRIHRLDRDRFESLIARSKFSCSNPECENPLHQYTWADVKNHVEGGEVIAVVREEESPISRTMKRIVVFWRPSTPDEEIAGDQQERDALYGFGVRR